jgi:hypothetical protein
MSNETRNLNSIVDITVQISPLAAPRATFNELLIIGTTDVIDTTERIRVYEDPADMLTDGFITTDPEYEAAQIYFSQSPAPRRLWVGRQDITISPAESCLDAVIACRAAGYDWYMFIALAAGSADHKELAEWTESAQPSTLYAFTTADADVLEANSSPVGIFEYLKTLNYSRTLGVYSTNQGGSPVLYPNNKYAAVSVMAYACGQNTGLAGSAFTLKFKNLIGIATEPLTSTKINNIEAQNGNVYLSYGNFYSFFEQGKMAKGYFFDEMINLDMLVNNIQLSVADLLNATPKVPQTDEGVTQLVHVVNQACEQAVNIGFLAPGTWTGVDLLNLKTGDMLPKGYVVQTQPLSEQSRADREARKSTPLYVAIKEAGAVHSILIGIYVNR